MFAVFFVTVHFYSLLYFFFFLTIHSGVDTGLEPEMT